MLAAEWWSPEGAGWVGGGIGVLGALFGTVLGCCGFLVQQGRGKGFVLGGFALMTALGVGSLLGATAALATDQPRHVLQPLLLCGVLFTLLGVLLGTNVRRQYRLVEARRLDAAQIRGG